MLESIFSFFVEHFVAFIDAKRRRMTSASSGLELETDRGSIVRLERHLDAVLMTAGQFFISRDFCFRLAMLAKVKKIPSTHEYFQRWHAFQI
jgi:hypothetical protein